MRCGRSSTVIVAEVLRGCDTPIVVGWLRGHARAEGRHRATFVHPFSVREKSWIRQILGVNLRREIRACSEEMSCACACVPYLVGLVLILSEGIVFVFVVVVARDVPLVTKRRDVFEIAHNASEKVVVETGAFFCVSTSRQ